MTNGWNVHKWNDTFYKKQCDCDTYTLIVYECNQM